MYTMYCPTNDKYADTSLQQQCEIMNFGTWFT